MRLSSFCVLRREAAAFKLTAAKAEKAARPYLQKFWPDLPMPRIKIVKRVGVAWLGRDKWTSSNPDNTILELNANLISSDEDLGKVIAHELIHHYHFLKEDYGTLSNSMFKALAHGVDFKRWANKINGWKGQGWVHEKSNEVLLHDIPEFMVLIKEVSPGTFGWMWAKRPSAKQKELIERFKQRGWVQTKATKYELTYGPRINKRGEYTTAPTVPSLNEILKTLYYKAAPKAA
jgi:hypothetical protein